MAEARVRIVLDLGEDSNTWVTAVPVRPCYPYRSTGVALAVGEAAALFTQSVLHDRELIAVKLAELEARDA